MNHGQEGKHPLFIIRQEQPFNAGAPLTLLGRSQVTPTELFFVRSHGNVPEVDVSTYRLKVGGAVTRPLALSLSELQAQFPSVMMAATLQCAGNRRQEMAAFKAIPDELGWNAEAIGHAVWTGVRLNDVLASAGVEVRSGATLHAAFVGLDETERLGQRMAFGGSIPLVKALGPEVILAYEMNGAPLAPVHGSPLRVVVPGYIGARSVKWLQSITVQESPSDNYFQAHAYRLFPPHVDKKTVDWDSGLMLGEMSLTSVICVPGEGQKLAVGPALVQGYAMAGGGRQVARVELSVDGGETWVDARLKGKPEPWSWRLWEATVTLHPGQHRLVVRAVDSAANSQPRAIGQVWNFKGYMNNAWHGVDVEVVPTGDD